MIDISYIYISFHAEFKVSIEYFKQVSREIVYKLLHTRE